MTRVRRQMSLTPELAAGAARFVEDAGPNPGAVYMSDEDYELALREMLTFAPPGGVWVFGYGSLLWKPGFDVVESRIATVSGWHRAFGFRVARFRGTRDQPGLMLALDRGGTCKGMILKLPQAQVEATLHTLFRREVMVKPAVNVPRWLTAKTDNGSIRAIAFVVNRESPHYAGKLRPDEVAGVLATAAGHWGTCAEYLRATVCRLEELGIHDRKLWQLQSLVADRLRN
ncbi:MAG: gamma-glutamylcyclotransferase [Gemmatimonadaceae bacterium]